MRLVINGQKDDEQIDIFSPSVLEIVIRNDSAVVWVNVEGKCRFRACEIQMLIIDDRRIPNE